MFIHSQGLPKGLSVENRRAINTHVSQRARTKRQAAKLLISAQDDRNTKVEKRQQAVRSTKSMILPIELLTTAILNETLDHRMTDDFMFSVPVGIERTYALPACRDFFTMVLALDGKILGLSPKRTQSYGQALLEWSSKHEILMLGLALYRLCALPAILDRSSNTRLIVDELRSRFIVLINEKLSSGQIDDILIQSLCCALPVDDHLGYADFSIAHLKGMEVILEIRGGLSQVGSSNSGVGSLLQLSVLHAISTTKLRIGTRLMCNSKGLTYPDFQLDSVQESWLIQLPRGFRILALTNHLSCTMLGILVEFNQWLLNLDLAEAENLPTWRHDIPAGLTNFEKCVFVALLCLADDLTTMGSHILSPLWRKAKYRAEEILNADELWNDPRCADCMLWTATVIALPRKDIPHDMLALLQTKILASRPDVTSSAHVESILSQFFFPALRSSVWLYSWAKQLYRQHSI